MRNIRPLVFNLTDTDIDWATRRWDPVIEEAYGHALTRRDPRDRAIGVVALVRAYALTFTSRSDCRLTAVIIDGDEEYLAVLTTKLAGIGLDVIHLRTVYLARDARKFGLMSRR